MKRVFQMQDLRKRDGMRAYDCIRSHLNAILDGKQNEETSHDAIYEETSPNATVWQTYMRESSKIDIRMVGECGENLDVLLVFVSLVFFPRYPF